MTSQRGSTRASLNYTGSGGKALSPRDEHAYLMPAAESLSPYDSRISAVLSSSSASRSDGLDDSRPCGRVDEVDRAGCLLTTAARLDFRGCRGPMGLVGEPNDDAEDWFRACCEMCEEATPLTVGAIELASAIWSRSSGGRTVAGGSNGTETGPLSVSVQPR